MGISGISADHLVHLVVFGIPALVLAVVVAAQELGTRRSRRGSAADPARSEAPTASGALLSSPAPVPRPSRWQWTAAAAMGVSAATHVAVVDQHLRESLLYGCFFVALATVQAAAAVLLLLRPSTRLLQRVALGCAGVVGLWLLSRTSGLPVGPEPWSAEGVGRPDVVATGAEVVAVLACSWLVATGAGVTERAPGQLRRELGELVTAVVGWLPHGHSLPRSIWWRRHQAIVRFALVQAVAVGVFAYLRGFGVLLCAADVALVGLPALFALSEAATRGVRTVAATTSLMLASVCVVDISGGATEAHFHFFVMVGVVALYQDWTAFGVCILITVVHHAVMGSLLPKDVYGSEAEQHDPIVWALIHGAFILAVAFTHLLAWRNNEAQFLSDSLTSLPNRTAFTERLDAALSDAAQTVSVLFVDLDNFKTINDSYGHAVGDGALRAAAARMTECSRHGDVLARLGGDEFAIIVRGSDASGATLAARIGAGLMDPVVVDGVTLHVRASIGVADTTQTGSRLGSHLLRCADLAMYMAKSTGKSNIVVYDAELDEAVRTRAELAASLGPALLDGQFEVHYQPVVEGDGGAVVGAEALLRWDHPEQGSVSPASFVPLAEETGDILAIGDWVLETATRQMAEWNASRPDLPQLTIAVNFSPVQISRRDFVASVTATLARTGLPARCLVAEVTEGLRLLDWKGSCAKLQELRDLGVLVAIDDFGTGYSSLSYLAELPADIIKIDRSFVRDLHADSGTLFLVNAIVDVATSLGLDVIAEGVERADQQALLSKLGCARAQGFLYSKAVPWDTFGALLAPPVAELAAAPVRSPG